jgi:hypothetical protein
VRGTIASRLRYWISEALGQSSAVALFRARRPAAWGAETVEAGSRHGRRCSRSDMVVGRWWGGSAARWEIASGGRSGRATVNHTGWSQIPSRWGFCLGYLFNHLVRADQQRGRNGEIESPRGLHVEY